MQIRKYVFTGAFTAISRFMAVRDVSLGRIGPLRRLRGRLAPGPMAVATRHAIASGNNVLDASFVRPAQGPVRAALLLCHGIGETVEHWLPVQRLFAAEGVASLVFDYSGYGRSTGWVSGPQCERDAVAAFELLERLVPGRSPALLGYSLGSGVAAAVVSRIKAERLILCAAFTSLRAAARSLGFPQFLALTLPDLWRAEQSLRGYNAPVLIVHGERDELFPLEMARELAGLCRSELIVVPEITHNQPFYRPDLAYWGLIVSRIREPETGETTNLAVEMPQGGNPARI